MDNPLVQQSIRISTIEKIIDGTLNNLVKQKDRLIQDFSPRYRGFVFVLIKDLDWSKELVTAEPIVGYLAGIPENYKKYNVKQEWQDKINSYNKDHKVIINCVVMENKIAHSKWLQC